MATYDADFAAYLAARWPSLVRTLVVLLGCSRSDAEVIAQGGMARCYPAWRRIRELDDLDTAVYAEVLQGNEEHRGRYAAEPEPALEVMAAELDRVGVEAREVLVLTEVAGLDEVQVAALLQIPVAELVGRGIRARAALDLTGVRDVLGYGDVALTLAEAFRLVAETIEIGPPPYDEIVARAHASRRRRTARLVGALAVIAIVVGVLTWLGAGPDPEPDDRPPAAAAVTEARNPVDVAWYANGLLHLDRVTVDLPQLTDLVEMPGGAVYGDLDGVVAFVSVDGDRRVLGHKATTSPLVGSREDGWVSWVDTEGLDGGSGPGLVVYDVARGVGVSPAEEAVPDAVPFAIDEHRVFYRTGARTYVWDPRNQILARDMRDGLVDIETATRVYQDGRSIDVVQTLFNVDERLPGLGGRLSAGGSFVISRSPDHDDPPGTFTPLVYDVRTGDPLPSGLGRGEVAVDASFGDNHSIVYLVARRDELTGPATLDGGAQPLLVLRSCDLGGSCTDVAPVQLLEGQALLGH